MTRAERGAKRVARTAKLWLRLGAIGSPLLALPVFGTGPAAAQIPPGAAVQAPDGRQAAPIPTRPQVEQPVPPEQRRTRARIDVGAALAAPPCPLEGSTVRMTLKDVRFEPARGGDLAPELARLLAPVAARTELGERPIASVCDIRDRANQALFAAGYVASVQIPQQDVTDGTLRLQVVAARIVEVRVQGVEGELSGSLAARVRALQGIDPLNQREAERLLLLAGDVPGLQLRLTLQPAGREPGDVIAVLDVEQQRGLVIGSFQNSGSRALGPAIFSLRGELYGLTGLNDQTYLGVSNTSTWNEVHVVQAGHSIGLGTEGVRLGVRGSYARSNPTIPDLDLGSRSLIAGLDLSAPLVRTLRRTGRTVDDINLFTGAGFELLNQRTVVRGAGGNTPFTRDRLRILYARGGGRYISRNAYGVAVSDVDAVVEMRRGLDVFDATQLRTSEDGFQPSRFAGDPRALEVRGTVNQTLRPFSGLPRLAFDLSAFGQWANNPLLNLEEFTIGNLTYGRGYDPGANAGDRAVAIRLQPRATLVAGPDGALDVFGFYEGVRFWNLDPGTTEIDRRLQSAGGGLRFSMPSRLAVELTYARPLDPVLRSDARRPSDRLLVSLTSQFAPWRFGR